MSIFMKYWWIWLLLALLSLSFRYDMHRNFAHTVATDTTFYDETAINIIEGKGYQQLSGGQLMFVSHHTPGYSLFLASIYSFVDRQEMLSNDAKRVKAVVLVQHILSVVTALLYVVLFTKFVKSPLWQFLFGIILLFNTQLIVFSSLLLPETLSTFMVAVGLCVLILSKTLHVRLKLGIGLWLGLLILVKPYFIYLPFAFGIWLWFQHESVRYRMRQISMLLLGLMIVIGTWLVYVYHHTAMIVPMQRGYTWVVKTSDCPKGVCQQHAEMNIQENKTEIDITRWVWWRTVHKWREYFGFVPEMPALVAKTIAGSNLFLNTSWLIQAVSWILIVMQFPFVPLTRYRLLLLLVIWGASMIHSYIWSLPRYGMALVPLIHLYGLSYVTKYDKRRLLYMVGIPFMLVLVAYLADGRYSSLLSLTTAFWGGYAVVNYYKELRNHSMFHNSYLALLISLWLVIMTITILPLVFQAIFPAFQWEKLVFPWVLATGGVTFY